MSPQDLFSVDDRCETKSQAERDNLRMTTPPARIEYSEKYMDSNYEYRHVILPKEHAKTLPKGRTLAEHEWRGAGVQQSRGWEHYAVHRPEPHILLFRRPLGTDPISGEIDPELQRVAKQEYEMELALNVAK